MKEDLKAGIKMAALTTSLILGAGFASGKEIISFFLDYGVMGFVGMFISGILFGFAAIGVMDVCFRKKIDNYNDYIEFIAGDKLSAIMEGLLGLFLFVLFSAMVSAFGSIFKEAFDFPLTYGIAGAGILCFICFLWGMEGIIKLNSYLAPIMIFGCIFIGVYTYIFRMNPEDVAMTAKPSNINWWISGILYASYNVIVSATVLSSLRKRIKTRRSIYLAGLFAGIMIFAIGLSLALTLNAHKPLIESYDIPIYALAGMYSPFFEIIFLVVFVTSVFTCAATNGYAFVQWFSLRFRLNRTVFAFFATILACIGAYAGFSNFINVIYPIFGVVGFMELVLIMRKLFVSWKENR